MMDWNARSIFLLLSTITTALSAGIFYAWVVSVIPGTKRISDQAYLETMQSINREILNPGFFVIFLGSVILLVISTAIEYKFKTQGAFYFVLSATLVYIFGTVGVTMFGNVPLNNMVDAMDLSSFSSQDFKNARIAYEDQWNNLNLVRTIAALLAFVLMLLTIFKN